MNDDTQKEASGSVKNPYDNSLLKGLEFGEGWEHPLDDYTAKATLTSRLAGAHSKADAEKNLASTTVTVSARVDVGKIGGAQNTRAFETAVKECFAGENVSVDCGVVRDGWSIPTGDKHSKKECNIVVPRDKKEEARQVFKRLVTLSKTAVQEPKPERTMY